jgi:hypothetical protein
MSSLVLLYEISAELTMAVSVGFMFVNVHIIVSGADNGISARVTVFYVWYGVLLLFAVFAEWGCGNGAFSCLELNIGFGEEVCGVYAAYFACAKSAVRYPVRMGKNVDDADFMVSWAGSFCGISVMKVIAAREFATEPDDGL